MRRLIDADALIGQYKGSCLTAKTDYAEGLRDVIADIKDAPTVDAVPVVRCRECAHCHEEMPNALWCQGRGIPYQLVPHDGFCDRGRRKEDTP